MLGTVGKDEFRTVHGLVVRRRERPGRYWFLVLSNTIAFVLSAVRLMCSLMG